MSDPTSPPPIEKNSEAGRANELVALAKLFFEKVDPVIHIVETVMDRRLRAAESESKFRVRMALVAILLVGLVVATAAYMTYLGKLDGSTFGFLLGLVVGYVLTFIRDAITAGTEPEV